MELGCVCSFQLTRGCRLLVPADGPLNPGKTPAQPATLRLNMQCWAGRIACAFSGFTQTNSEHCAGEGFGEDEQPSRAKSPAAHASASRQAHANLDLPPSGMPLSHALNHQFRH